MFHLTTHAIFKALLFLVAGAYIHHVGSNDMIAIGRAGGRKMKAMTIGLILAGRPWRVFRRSWLLLQGVHPS